jgi:SAM-dependent methyltransferase
MLSKFRNYIRGLSFMPGILGILFNPFYLARRGLSEALAKYATIADGKLLDVGCGTKPYKSIFNVTEYVGIDIDNAGTRQTNIADKFYDGTTFPVDDSEFNVVLCNQVLEHVFNPIEFMQEIYRVLMPNGKLIITVPFVWDEHEQPFDYARYTSFGLKALLEENGFKIVTHEKIGDDASILFQLTNAYLYKVTIKWNRYIRAIFAVLIMGGINLLGLLAKFISPKNADLFLDQIVIAEKL